ncbi:MAG TPA: hypothetical protein VG055_29850 [Planctomycetaceae bacterium]|nr:hypothetical protein [Planctomycetaceae bacterium]
MRTLQFASADGPDKPLKIPSTCHWEFDQDGDAFLLKVAPAVASFNQVFARNARYAFEIQVPNEKKGWKLADFEKAAHDGKVTSSAHQQLLDVLHCPHQVWNYPAQRVFDAGLLEAVTAISAGVGPNELVTVNFQRRRNAASHERIDSIEGGEIRLEPRRHWAIRDFDLRVDPSRRQVTRIRQTCSYQAPESAIPAAIQFEFESETPNGPTVNRWVIAIDEVKPSTLTERDYLLPAFGVAEPPLSGTMSLMNKGWFWLLQAGIFAVLIGLLLRHRAKRRIP